MDHVTLTMPFGDEISSAGWDLIVMANLYTKFEVSICTCYEDMKSSAKCSNMGGLQPLEVTKGHRQYHTSIECIRLPILHRFRDTASHLLKVACFSLPHLHSARLYGLTPEEFHKHLW